MSAVTSHRMTEPMLSAVYGKGGINVIENARTAIATYDSNDKALAFIEGYHAADKALRTQRDELLAALRGLTRFVETQSNLIDHSRYPSSNALPQELQGAAEAAHQAQAGFVHQSRFATASARAAIAKAGAA